MSTQGTILAIYIAPGEAAEPFEIAEASLVAEHGIEGDRYHSGTGRFSDGVADRGLTLIEAEAIEAMATETGIELEARLARRNMVTRGIDLNSLVGKTFHVGEVECFGEERADPCAYLQSLTEPGVLKGLVDRGGLRARILGTGKVRAGEAVG